MKKTAGLGRLNDITTTLFGKSFAKTFDGIPAENVKNGGNGTVKGDWEIGGGNDT